MPQIRLRRATQVNLTPETEAAIWIRLTVPKESTTGNEEELVSQDETVARPCRNGNWILLVTITSVHSNCHQHLTVDLLSFIC